MKGIRKTERGIALFLVLWVMALLTVIAGEFCYAVRTEVNVTRNFREETQTYYIAMSGLFLTVKELVGNGYVSPPVRTSVNAEETEDPRWRINTDFPAVPFGGGWFKVEKENESGKVNLNRAGAALLRIMLNTFPIEDADKNIIVDSIQDWRDRDNFHRANGAEDDYYLSLPQPYKCKNGEFTSTDELLLVRGVTPQIFYGGLKDMVSIHQDKETETTPATGLTQVAGAAPVRRYEPDYNRINVNAASPRMLRSLPGMTEDALQAVMKYRARRDFRSMPELYNVVGGAVYAGIAPYIALNLFPYYTIKSAGMLEGSRTRQGVQAVVKIDRNLDKGYEIIQWIDSLEFGSERIPRS
jgi:general secretion pathway protein K